MITFQEFLKIKTEDVSTMGITSTHPSNILANRQFLSWFGNSKVVDKNGNPKVCYHGTPTAVFSRFDIKKQNPEDLYGPGFYFTEDPKEASAYSSRVSNPFGGELTKNPNPAVYPVYLRITNPFYADSFFMRLRSSGTYKDPRLAFGYDFLGDALSGNKEATKRLRDLGYDGIKAGNYWIVFSPNQIKSVYNKGTFNLNSDELGEYFSKVLS